MMQRSTLTSSEPAYTVLATNLATVPFSSSSDPWHVLYGRPDLADIIESVFEFPGSVGVASCGPRSFTQDVRSAIALEQKDIALGYDVRDVALYTEEFEW
jgi:hypothetical protein